MTYLNLVPPEIREEFSEFVKTGNASKTFLERLGQDPAMQRAADMAFAEQITALAAQPVPGSLAERTADLLKQATNLPADERKSEFKTAAERARRDDTRGVVEVIEDLRASIGADV